VCVHTPVDDASAVGSKGWRSVDDASLWHGSARTTKKKGATLTVPGAVAVDRVGVVATTCPGCGKVVVYVGTTKIGVLNLDSQKVKRRVVMVLPQLSSPLDGAIQVVVETVDKKVQIDGVVVAGSPVD
jgi:hypothetical protein